MRAREPAHRAGLHQHAVQMGYRVSEEADGTFTVQHRSEIVRRGFRSRAAAWDWAEERAYAGD